jgi:small subunit ribosomal protein S1
MRGHLESSDDWKEVEQMSSDIGRFDGNGERTYNNHPESRGRSVPPDFGEDGSAHGGSAEFARMLEQFESSREAGTPLVGHQVRGRIVQIGPDISFVDFGGRSEGAIETRYFRDPEGQLTAQVGDMVDLFVVDNQDQVILAPSVRAAPNVALDQVLDARRTGMPISGKVSGLNAGGLEIDLAGLRGFCPVSQIDAGFCPDPAVYLGKTLEFLVTEVAEGGKRLVLSRKALLRREEEEKAKKLMQGLKDGSEHEGTVVRLETFGAFVDLGGVDGLVHVSEIRYERTENPAEVLAVGQKVRVKVLGVKEVAGGRPKISLSMKAAAPDPWDEVEERFWPGRRVEGSVVRLTDFGAFINLAPGIDGLAHVSEVALHPVAHARDAVSTGQRVAAIVLAVDREKRRISLSIRDALAADLAVSGPEEGEGSVASSPGSPADSASGPGPGTAIGSGGPGAIGAPTQLKPPAAGDLADGWVAGIKPYGLFVDLPAYGHRARGLVPMEETGERPGTDLLRRFKIGDQLRVAIIEVDAEGKIRLSLTRARDAAEQVQFKKFQEAAAPARTANTAMAEALKKAMERQRGS